LAAASCLRGKHMEWLIRGYLYDALLAAGVAMMTEAVDLWVTSTGSKLGPVGRLAMVGAAAFCATMVAITLLRGNSMGSRSVGRCTPHEARYLQSLRMCRTMATS
jgi:hypothetical protein